ncbi:MAG: (Fe-S)-binding protein [Proteobacteria bacterium]|nr:(Fe-S)-binding protein [Pseudomonadota bacterium]
MPIDTAAFLSSLDDRVEDIVDACTRCGKCALVCPTPALAGIGAVSNEALTGGVIDILKDMPHSLEAETWARACCGSGFCIDACPEGINPRFMLTMARRSLNERRPADDARAEGRQAFKAMQSGVRMLSRLQLAPELLARINPAAAVDLVRPVGVAAILLIELAIQQGWSIGVGTARLHLDRRDLAGLPQSIFPIH